MSVVVAAWERAERALCRFSGALRTSVPAPAEAITKFLLRKTSRQAETRAAIHATIARDEFSNPFGCRLTLRIGTRASRGGKHMHKSLIALGGAAGIAIAAMMAPAPANADCVGCAVGAGILGGVAAGAIIGSAIANSPPPPPPAAYYGPPPPPRDEYAYRGECRELRQACLHREELGEEGMGNCRRYRELCR
jgi:hypothetical protein